MPITVDVISSTGGVLSASLIGVVPGTTQFVAYADIAAAVLAYGENPSSAIVQALTATYASRDAALEAMYGSFFVGYAAPPLPTTPPAILFEATGISLTTQPGTITGTTLGIVAYIDAELALVASGGQSARFTFGTPDEQSITGSLAGLAPLSKLVALLPRQTPIKSALAQLAACSTPAQMVAVLRSTQLSIAAGPAQAMGNDIFPPIASISPGQGVDSNGEPTVFSPLDITYGVADITFTVPHSIIQ